MAVKNQPCFVAGVESWIAGAAINKYDAVKLHTTEGCVMKTAVLADVNGMYGDRVVGFALSDADAGQPVSVQTKGTARGRASDVIAIGASVQGTTDGELVTAGTTAHKVYKCIGVAASAAGAANEIISVVIQRHDNHLNA